MTQKISIGAAGAIALVYMLTASGADAMRAGYQEKSLYDFCKRGCGGDPIPSGSVVIDSSGNIYGTTDFGGTAGAGSVFKLTPNGKKYTYSEIFDFGVTDTQEEPLGDLSLDGDGNLYGTISGGTTDATSCGAVFELSPDGGTWSLSIIEQFPESGSEGCHPSGGLTYAGKNLGQPWDGSSPLFGSTADGGEYSAGVAYQLLRDGSLWNESTIHTFHDALYPGPLLEDSAGNLWGTTDSGGSSGEGIIFELAAGTWKETILYAFCSLANCADGLTPYGRLYMDGSGNIFGVTHEGGAYTSCGDNYGCGVVFELTAGGTYRLLYNFCSVVNCEDGAGPLGGVIMNASGALVGTTAFGGSGEYSLNQYGAGVAFELANTGGVWSETIDHDFCSKPGCKDGESPDADPVPDSSGTVFAVTNGGGDTDGNVFELRPR